MGSINWVITELAVAGGPKPSGGSQLSRFFGFKTQKSGKKYKTTSDYYQILLEM